MPQTDVGQTRWTSALQASRQKECTGDQDARDEKREREKRQQREQRLLTFCVAGPFVILLLNLLPGLGGVPSAISFSLAAAFLLVLILVISTGVRDRFRRAERAPDSRENA